LIMLVLAASCSGGPTTAEYAEDVEALVTTMNARLDQLDAEAEGTSDLELIQRYAEERVSARSGFVDGLHELEPPDELKVFHFTALEIMERLTNAESVLADRVMQLESADGIEDIWATPEGVAARAADAQAVSLCLAAQAEFDQTAERAELEDVPWIPTEMKAVILVAFGCESDAR
jgi:hypothetical protein